MTYALLLSESIHHDCRNATPRKKARKPNELATQLSTQSEASIAPRVKSGSWPTSGHLGTRPNALYAMTQSHTQTRRCRANFPSRDKRPSFSPGTPTTTPDTNH